MSERLMRKWLRTMELREARAQEKKATPRRPNASQKRALRTAELAKFVAAVGRKSIHRNGGDPNDRDYDPEFAKHLRAMRPDDFDRILRDDED
jgi:hypothetical protein